ncbi:peroxiredoxin family protein [Mucilaginibacter endophyticus]|uniref:peroxiredoxin family protein n=1 Tax=Mucilaginibacter endophyticus TaxID=2675003 RepID=UPI000E0D12E7|nr:TlpA disulfide reductase family protein [Mucilaginibacter endophyticus]
MKKNLSFLIGLFLTISAHAQMQVSKFILPDGKEVPPGKLDSVEKAWGGEIMFQHDDEDDKKHIMHLIRRTPEMAKAMEEASRKQQMAMESMIGRPAADFSLMDLEGKEVTLSKLKGKVIVLNFWFTSCPPCNTEMPELNKLVKNFDGKDVVFLALTFNNPNMIKEFLKNHSFFYTILPSSRTVDKFYQITSWPTSFVIARDGNVAFAVNFKDDIYAVLSKQITSVLNK